MEAPPRIRDSEDNFGNKTLVGGCVKVASESCNAKRKVESASSYGLFCVMRKRSCRHKSVDDDDMFSDLDDAENDVDTQNCLRPESDLRFEYPNYLVDEDVIVDTDPSESSEFTGSKSLSICNFGWPSEDDEGTLVSNLFSETQTCILVRPPDEVNEVVNAVSSYEDEVLATKKTIPICIVPPDPDDGWSRTLLQTCSLNKIVSCGNEYNVHDDKIGLELSPIPLRKTLEGTSRPWSVCGSLAAVRNLTLMEDSSGACDSLDEQLVVNVSNSEDKDAETAQTRSVLFQEDVIGEDEICFSDIDALIRKLNLLPDDSDSFVNREEWNMSNHPRHTLFGLEHCSRASIRRPIMSQGAIALLHCRDSKHLIRKHEVIIGRSSGGLKVDIDMGKVGYGSKICRRQALVKLQNNGSFSLKNLGKRPILVNGEKLDTEETVTLTSCSSIDIRGIVFAFKSNKEAVRQFLKKSKRRNSDTKFRWCE